MTRIFPTPLLIAIGLCLALVPACKRGQSSTPSDTDETVRPIIPCAIETRPLSDESASFKTVVSIEPLDDQTYMQKLDSRGDGVWDTCIKFHLGDDDVITGEVDGGCDGTVDFETRYEPDEELNLVTATTNEASEMTLIVSARPGVYYWEHTAFPLFGARSNYAFESTDGRITRLIDHGQTTLFAYDNQGKIARAYGETGPIVEYEYDLSSKIVGAKWFKRDLLVRVVYECS